MHYNIGGKKKSLGKAYGIKVWGLLGKCWEHVENPLGTFWKALGNFMRIIKTQKPNLVEPLGTWWEHHNPKRHLSLPPSQCLLRCLIGCMKLFWET